MTLRTNFEHLVRPIARQSTSQNTRCSCKRFLYNLISPLVPAFENDRERKSEMNVPRLCIWLALFHCTITGMLVGQTAKPDDNSPQAHVSRVTIDPQTITILHLRPGFVSSIRLPEEITSVVLGNPQEFKAEHSEAEPRLVFLKPITAKAAETNALITTKTGHEISLHLVSNARSGNAQVDFFLDYERPHSFLIPADDSSFAIGQTRSLNAEDTPQQDTATVWIEQQLRKQTKSSISQWSGKRLQVAVGEAAESNHYMSVTFSVLNNSGATIELLPPQLRLAGPMNGKDSNKVKAEPVAIDQYKLTALKLGPGARADGVLLFERPEFKESSEQLLLQIAQVEQVDRPVLVPVSFTAPIARTAQ